MKQVYGGDEALTQTVYQISIPLFEGPMDLLLHLVTKNKIDIHDIPIHEITDQYLEYLEKANSFNLELGSHFFTMATTLILMKSKMLLPKRNEEEESEWEDSRRELERSLEEFRQMKILRVRLEELFQQESVYHQKAPSEVRSGVYTGRISLQKLSAAFFSLYEAMNETEEKVLPMEEVSLDDEIKSWRYVLCNHSSVELITYFLTKKTRLRLAVSLMALLELIRIGEVVIRDTASGLVAEGGC